MAAALRYCREQTTPKRVVTFVCDSGNKYLSKMFNDHWMADQGFRRTQPLRRPARLDRRAALPTARVVSVAPDEPLTIAYARMRLYDVSQLPVLERAADRGHPRRIGLAAGRQRRRGRAFAQPGRDFMTTQAGDGAAAHAASKDLLPIFDAGRVAIVADETGFHGLITRVDVLNYLAPPAA